MIVWGDVRRTFGDALTRADALAAHLHERGLGVHRERAELENWECGQDRVAILMHNRPEHVESILACWRARAVPCNVNYQYTASEIAELFRMLGTRGVVYERGLAPLLRDALAQLAAESDREVAVLVELDDGSDAAGIPGAVDFEIRRRRGWPDRGHPPWSWHIARRHLHRVHRRDDRPPQSRPVATGRPVRRRHRWHRRDGRGDHRARAEAGAGVWFPTSPLMHVAAQWTVFLAASMGATVVLHDDSRRFDAPTILATAAHERANMMTIIGDAYRATTARGAAHERVRPVGARGAGHRRHAHQRRREGRARRDAARRHHPRRLRRVGDRGDGLGRPGRPRRADPALPGHPLRAHPHRGSDPLPLPDETEVVGWIVRTGHVPLGYLDDEAATNATFPVVEGERVAVAGDRAQYTDDGQVVLLGRDSLVVNTGGEKVFVEEVEDVLKRHDAVVDVFVTGRPSERFGQEVVAVVQLTRPDACTPAELRAWCTEHLARYKAPRAVVFVDEVRRHPSGKADYRWAKERAVDAVDAVG